ALVGCDRQLDRARYAVEVQHAVSGCWSGRGSAGDKCAPTFEKPMAVVRGCGLTADLSAELDLAGAGQLCIARFSATHPCPRRTPRPGEGLPSRPDKADSPRVPAVDRRSVLLFVLGQ